MKKRLILFLSCMFASVGFIVAQQQIQGSVFDEAGEPLISASVIVKGTQIGTATDMDGKFVINMPEGKKILVFHLIGMKSVEKEAKDGMRVVMEEDQAMLDEVFVVAYGTSTKSTFTGSAGLISDKIMKDAPVTTFEQALQGASAGMNISAASGQPGTAQKITLRGVGSINASTEPLYVIDGVPMVMENLAVSGVEGQTGNTSISNFINPADIADISVLKDAAAASMYGSRGANGVIMVTTKAGTAGKTQVSLKASVGFSGWAVKSRPIIGGDDLRELWTESVYNYFEDGGWAAAMPGVPFDREQALAMSRDEVDEVAPKPLNGKYYDWDKALFKKRPVTQKYDVSIRGGSKDTQFYISLGYNDQKGMAKNSAYKQYSGMLNLTHKVGNLTIKGNTSIAKSTKDFVTEGFSYTNPFFATRTFLLPTTPIHNEDGSYYTGELLSGYPNLVREQNLEMYKNKMFNVKAGISFEYELIDNLKLKQNFNLDHQSIKGTTKWPLTSNNGANAKGLVVKIDPENNKLYSSSQASYMHQFGKHTVDALFAWDMERNTNTIVQAVGMGFPSDNLGELASSATPSEVYSNNEEDRMMSAITRFNYNYDHKYYASVSYRTDGSSRFGGNNRWGNFWSVSGSWRISNEKFMQNLEWINDLKVRGSYGVNGTLPTERFGYLKGFASKSVDGNGDYGGEAGLFPTRIANPDLSWEENHVMDFGLEFKLFDRFTFELDYYNRKTKDLLMEVPISLTSGFGSVLQNEGEMTNKGIELTLGYILTTVPDFTWSTSLNISHNKNKLSKIYGGNDFTEPDPNLNMIIHRQGEAYNSFYLREFAGFDRETGQEMWYTNKPQADGSLSRDVTTDPTKVDRIIAGKADADLKGGWQNTFEYKGFDLTALLSFSFGGKLYDQGALYGDSNGVFDLQFLPSVYQKDRWQKPGDDTRYGRRTFNYQWGNYGSSKFLRSATYARLKNLALGYTIPAHLTKKAGMSRVRLSVAATNVFTIKRARGLDPEADINGLVGYAFPSLRTVTFGVEVNF